VLSWTVEPPELPGIASVRLIVPNGDARLAIATLKRRDNHRAVARGGGKWIRSVEYLFALPPFYDHHMAAMPSEPPVDQREQHPLQLVIVHDRSLAAAGLISCHSVMLDKSR
jgi:hypothetical protein